MDFPTYSDMIEKDKIIPAQETGNAIEATADVSLRSEQEARDVFRIAKKRLQTVNAWHKIAKNISAEFHLVTDCGDSLTREPREGDFFKIDIPGPGTNAGQGFDWVQLEEVVSTNNNDEESYGFRVRPSQNPVDKNGDVAHFYSPESTSTFMVTRDKNIVSARVYDRNTKTNENVNQAGDIVRDAVVSAAGLLGFSKLQWNGLVKGLIAQENN
jgi:hypothetical protein